MKKYYVILWIVMAVNSVHAQPEQIYKWTDENGSVHFSDKSHPGAEQVEIPKVQTYSSPKTPTPEKSSDSISDPDTGHYEKISIVQPEDQATIRNPQGYVSVILDLKPKLRDGDKVQVIFDGTPLAEPQAATVFALQDIKRGSHTLAAQVVDIKGNVLNTSDLVTFFMMPPRVGMVHKNP